MKVLDKNIISNLLAFLLILTKILFDIYPVNNIWKEAENGLSLLFIFNPLLTEILPLYEGEGGNFFSRVC